ncbi:MULTISPECIES: MCE family protein [unclassified Crossiella]|uniref:MCE family protein n=1 Tax=unclassified Crossiella TaxID=2620835 RepID=UPI001FFEC4D9|nr:MULTISPECIES: MCE family protein [unclassified Crossiella]MCK2241988.1 MCE family protein [Crossiella sp. S99.2]MCK2255891.1 MCE family protein [Crossiella sp. S99.1]
MTHRNTTGRSLTNVLALACVTALLLSASLVWLQGGSGGSSITAFFARTVGLYPGSEVRVLGVPVGRVREVTPEGERVRVRFEVDRGIRIPAEAKAVVIAPSLVSDRYLQLTPAYETGPELAGGAEIPLTRTMIPVELDELLGDVGELSRALGPDGANKNGALSGLLDTAAANLKGNGAALNATVKDLAAAAETLNRSRKDLFATVDGLRQFTAALVASDGQLRAFNNRLASVSGHLAAEREQLGAALQGLAGAMIDVKEFITANQDRLKSTVDKLASVTKVLVDQRAALAEVLDVAPLAATNYLNSYDAASGTFAVRGAINELTYPPVLLLCRVIQAGTPKQLPKLIGDACAQLAPLLDGVLKLPSPAEILASLQQGRLPKLPLLGGR